MHQRQEADAATQKTGDTAGRQGEGYGELEDAEATRETAFPRGSGLRGSYTDAMTMLPCTFTRECGNHTHERVTIRRSARSGIGPVGAPEERTESNERRSTVPPLRPPQPRSVTARLGSTRARCVILSAPEPQIPALAPRLGRSSSQCPAVRHPRAPNWGCQRCVRAPGRVHAAPAARAVHETVDGRRFGEHGLAEAQHVVGATRVNARDRPGSMRLPFARQTRQLRAPATEFSRRCFAGSGVVASCVITKSDRTRPVDPAVRHHADVSPGASTRPRIDRSEVQGGAALERFRPTASWNRPALISSGRAASSSRSVALRLAGFNTRG